MFFSFNEYAVSFPFILSGLGVKATLTGIIIASPASFLFAFDFSTFLYHFYPMMISTHDEKCVPWMLWKDEASFLIQSDSLCLLIKELRPSIFRFLVSSVHWYVLFCCYLVSIFPSFDLLFSESLFPLTR